MTEYHEGDTITLERGEDRLVREVRETTSAKVFVIDTGFGSPVGVQDALNRGWTITSVTPKPAPLPEGWYRSGFKSNVFAHFDGEWWEHSASGSWKRTYGEVLALLDPLPLTRLIPESEVSAKVAEARVDERSAIVTRIRLMFPEGADGHSAASAIARDIELSA